MRFAIALLIGLMMGTLGASFALNALRQAHALPRGLMVLIDHHQRRVKSEMAASNCSSATLRHHFVRLNMLSEDIDAIFAVTDDAVFTRYAADFHDATSAALAIPDAACSALAPAAARINDTCNACHRDYR